MVNSPRIPLAALGAAVLSIIVLHGGDAQALSPRTLYQVCDRITAGPETTACLEAGRDRHLDEYALGACDRLTNNRATVNCVETIADKVYRPEEVEVCNRITNNDETVNCLASTGRSVGRPPHGGGDWRAILRDILRDCRQRNQYDREVLRCVELTAGY